MSSTLIHSVLLFDGTDVRQNATVLFDSQTGKIISVSAVGPEVNSLKDTTVVDGTGCSLIPGLIDAHVHIHSLHLPAEEVDSAAATILTTPLKCGITTICDMHTDVSTVQSARDEIKREVERARNKPGSERVTMTDLKSCLLAATIEGGWPKPIVLGHHPTEELRAAVAKWPNVTVDSAIEYIDSQEKDGADYIKLMQENCCSLKFPARDVSVASLELQTAVVKAAHARNFIVVGHALSLDMTEVVLRSGADGLTHLFVDQMPSKEIVEMFKSTKAFVIPTLTVLASATGEEQVYRDRFAELASKKNLLGDFVKQTMLDSMQVGASQTKIQNSYTAVRELRSAGVDIVAGTDSVAGLKGTALGPSLWMEMAMYVDNCGMTPLDVLKSATSVTARRFGFSDRGGIAVGKRADMVLVKGDITQNLECLWQDDGIVGVWKQGCSAAL